jgi:23S rRNA (cytosine1962-C5)-methyltransferase
VSFVAPPVTERRMAVRLTTAAERQVRLRHPWVFNKSVESTSHDGAPGDLAVIFDKKRAFVGIGLWDPASPIRIRMVHVGKPRTIDADFWRERVLEALTRRDALITDPATTAYRVIHGENDGFSGLVCDLYDTTLVVKLYSAVWLPHLQSIVEALADLLDVESAVVRLGRLAASQDLQGLESGMALVGKAPTAPVAFLENGLEFHADVIEGQKTGHFLDQRDNRAMVRALTEGAKVLDVFSCTGGFSVHAAAGGARSVTSIDVSPGALAAAQANMAANNDIAAVAACRHQVLRGDAFDLMESAIRQGERYDFVIIDPPSFAARRIQIGPALHSYNRLTTLGLALCADEGTLVQASCSSRVTTEDFLAIVHGAAAEVDIALDDAVVTGHGADHPIGFAEGSYLKAIFATPRSVSSF